MIPPNLLRVLFVPSIGFRVITSSGRCISYGIPPITGGRNIKDLRCTQKTIYFAIFTNNIWSCLLWSPVRGGGGFTRNPFGVGGCWSPSPLQNYTIVCPIEGVLRRCSLQRKLLLLPPGGYFFCFYLEDCTLLCPLEGVVTASLLLGGISCITKPSPFQGRRSPVSSGGVALSTIEVAHFRYLFSE